MFLQVELKPDHAKLQADQKYRPVGGFDMTRDEARDMLGPSGGTEVLQSNLANHEHMKKKGGLGVAPLVLEAHGLVDIVNIPLPSREGARKAQTSMDWGKSWVCPITQNFRLQFHT